MSSRVCHASAVCCVGRPSGGPRRAPAAGAHRAFLWGCRASAGASRVGARRRASHMIGAQAALGEVELLLRRLRWALAELPFIVAFAAARTLANAWCTSRPMTSLRGWAAVGGDDIRHYLACPFFLRFSSASRRLPPWVGTRNLRIALNFVPFQRDVVVPSMSWMHVAYMHAEARHCGRVMRPEHTMRKSFGQCFARQLLGPPWLAPRSQAARSALRGGSACQPADLLRCFDLRSNKAHLSVLAGPPGTSPGTSPPMADQQKCCRMSPDLRHAVTRGCGEKRPTPGLSQ